MKKSFDVKRVFDGPIGPIEHVLVQSSYTSRSIVVDGEEVGKLYLMAGGRWAIKGLISSRRKFASQQVAAEYWLMWQALSERARCPRCQTNMSCMTWMCRECGATRVHRNWPPVEEVGLGKASKVKETHE